LAAGYVPAGVLITCRLECPTSFSTLHWALSPPTLLLTLFRPRLSNLLYCRLGDFPPLPRKIPRLLPASYAFVSTSFFFCSLFRVFSLSPIRVSVLDRRVIPPSSYFFSSRPRTVSYVAPVPFCSPEVGVFFFCGPLSVPVSLLRSNRSSYFPLSCTRMAQPQASPTSPIRSGNFSRNHKPHSRVSLLFRCS